MLDQHGVDGDAYDDEKRLKTQGEQGAQIILSHAAAHFPVEHHRHGDGCDGGYEVYLDHAAIYDHEYADGKRRHGESDDEALEQKSKQRASVHSLKLGLDASKNTPVSDDPLSDIPSEWLRAVERLKDHRNYVVKRKAKK